MRAFCVCVGCAGVFDGMSQLEASILESLKDVLLLTFLSLILRKRVMA